MAEIVYYVCRGSGTILSNELGDTFHDNVHMINWFL